MAAPEDNFMKDERPNVLMICVDHWPGALLGSAGHKGIMTPTLDQLCDNGILFTEAYSCTPTCIPARRTLMTGTSAKTHGDRTFQQTLRMPEGIPTLAETMKSAGYQCSAVGKLHTYPQRNRLGFDEALICEEGRHHLGLDRDDYELYLAENGQLGAELSHGMSVNQYTVRPWHLDEKYHPTHWITKNMCRSIQRRNPEKPGFWYCSYTAPHPPITPLHDYLDMYRDIEMDEPYTAEWAENYDELPYALKNQINRKRTPTGPRAMEQAKKGFYAQCTYVDHQIRLLLGTLWEEGLLDNTMIIFTCDHGDALGNHNLLGKKQMFESTAKIPMIFVPPAGTDMEGLKKDNLVCLRDVMPTILEQCNIQLPDSVEGQSMFSESSRAYLYGEHDEGDTATRMIRQGDYKLIYFPTGNRSYLFDLKNDPCELNNLEEHEEFSSILEELKSLLVKELYGDDLKWIKNGTLIGLPDKEYQVFADRNLSAQRGWRI
ncbi:arylsulfatase [Oceanispirochaeta sp. M1]|nr:arylsulfatase [Oceanispirochaeta sp. M1]